jgi:hypothetical protein
MKEINLVSLPTVDKETKDLNVVVETPVVSRGWWKK